MTDYIGAATYDLLDPPIPGSVRTAYYWRPQFTGSEAVVDDTAAYSEPGVFGSYSNTGGKSSFGGTNYNGYFADRMTPAYDWFEKFHVIPRSFTFGNILSTQVAAIEVYNAFRSQSHYWTTLVNNAGAGVSLLGQPTLPTLVPFQHGVQMTLQVSTSGPPRVDSTLDFSFDTGVTIYVPISLQRVVLFDVQPEQGYEERLDWLTDIIPHRDGSEQRIALRNYPRQVFEWEVILADGNERSRVETILFDWQSSVFGVPVWHEAVHTTVAHTAGGLVVTVPSTANADYRVGGLFVVFSAQGVYDVLQLASMTSTQLTATTALLNSYPAGVLVAPLRTALTTTSVGGSRWRLNGARLHMLFVVNDNANSIESVAGFPSLNGKVLFSTGNAVSATLQESFERQLLVLDSQTGPIYQVARNDRSRRVSSQTFRTAGMAELWSLRQCLYSLKGRSTSFYLPTFYNDLQLASSLVSGSTSMVINYVGYSQFVRNRQPKNIVRVCLTDGTFITRTVTASSSGGATETLTVDVAWAANVPVANVSRIEFVEEVRMDSDTVAIQHLPGERIQRTSFPVRTVLE